MKYKLLAVLTSLAIMFSFALPASNVLAAAYGTPFVTSITYQNLSSTAANITFNFQAENSATQTPYNTSLNGNAVGSLFLGNVNGISAGFKGSAVMSSDQPIVATLVQVPSSATVKNRPLSDGFSTGSSTVLIATALKNNFDTTSILTVQNSDSVGADLTVKFFAVGNPVAVDTINVTNLPAGASKYFDLGTIGSPLPDPFNGSVTVTAVKTGTATPGNAVATVMELATGGGNPNAASAFEGVASGATTVYMPSALCQAFGGTNSAYAVQNTSTTTTANVTTHYSSGQNPIFAIPPGGKHSFVACSDGVPAGTSGSATITSDQPIVAIGKVFGLGLSTAFVGASTGGNHIALPYVRWASDGNGDWSNGTEQRTFIAIQNIGAPLAGGTVVVHYLDKNGVEQGTQTIAAALATGGKANSNYSTSVHSIPEFGIYGDGSHGGGVSITAPGGSQLVAIARVETVYPSLPNLVGEDYNGFSVP